MRLMPSSSVPNRSRAWTPTTAWLIKAVRSLEPHLASRYRLTLGLVFLNQRFAFLSIHYCLVLIGRLKNI
jgi:hypothetical protein